nr:EAL domain-containing protein [Lachnospiraceae bacterium]
GEETGEKAILTECEGNVGRLAKILALDLEAALAASSPGEGVESSENPLSADYRMQRGEDGSYVGAEAHLKWEHRRYGPVDPPLLLQIAKESGDLYLLETNIIERAIKDAEEFRRKYGQQFVMDVFVTASTLYDRRFVPYLQNMADVYRLRTGYIRIKIADPYNLEDPEKTDLLFARIRTYGFVMAEEEK